MFSSANPLNWFGSLLASTSATHPASVTATSSSNQASLTLNMSEQQQTADRVNQFAPSEIISLNTFDLNFAGITQSLHIGLTFKGHNAPIERVKLEQLTEATKAVFELTYKALEEQKIALEHKSKLSKKEKKELAELNHKLGVLNNISSFSFIQKGNDPYLKVISKDKNQEPLWIHLNSTIFEDIHTLAQRHVENQVYYLQNQHTSGSLNAEEIHRLDLMKYYLETRKNPFNPHPEIVRENNGRCFIQFQRQNGRIEPIEIDSKLHPHIGARRLQIDEFFQIFIKECNRVVETNHDFAKKVGLINQQQQVAIEQQRQLAAAQQQQAQQQAQLAAATQQAARLS